ncbi:hypothetical protein HY967_04425 [Candidatus Jorgensenbacteria bacterium]|nr:hypothetical protein [Candidatus Jorgensenbacteria bacterium]
MTSHNRIIIWLVIFVTLFSLNSGVALAESSTIQKAIENVRDRLDDLVTAKDENNLTELALRIETFKKVIEFSVAEAKDFKVKLLTIDTADQEISVWREAIIKELDRSLEYYENSAKQLETVEKTIDLPTIQTMAQKFKSWRETNYLPVTNQIRDFILIQGEIKAIQTAKRRFQKIEEDVAKIKKARVKGSERLTKLLDRAEGLIKGGEGLNKEAQTIFTAYLATNSLTTTTTTSTPTSTSPLTESTNLPTVSSPENTTLFLAPTESNNASTTPTSTVTSTMLNATTTPTVPPQPSTTSIRDLVKTSLSNLKEAYQVFIEMSNLVRELLK